MCAESDILSKIFPIVQLAIPAIPELYSEEVYLRGIIATDALTPISFILHDSPALAHNLYSSFSLTPSNKRLMTRDSSEGKTKGKLGSGECS